MTAIEKYREMRDALRSEGLDLTIRSLHEFYGPDAGNIIYELQKELDELRALGHTLEMGNERVAAYINGAEGRD